MQSAEDLKQSQALDAQRRRDQALVEGVQNWDKYSPVFISADEKGLLEGYGAQNFEGRADLFAENPTKYAALFIKVLTNISATEKEIHEYVLGLIDQLLQDNPNRAREFHAITDAYTPLMRIIHRDRATDDAKTFVEKACRILSVLLSNDVPEENKFVGEFLNWLISRIQPSPQEAKQGVGQARATQLLFKAASLKDMLKRPENQTMFIERGGLPAVRAMIDLESQNTQLVYLLGFCVWLLTFNKDCLRGLRESQIVTSLARILRVSVREKVIRICFASLKNLINYGKEGGFEEEMIGLDVPKLAQTCLARNFKDKDIEEDIKVIEKKLDKAIEELSSWELYLAEVRAGQLKKGAVHTETFFKENNMKFEGGDFEIVKKLIELLPTSLEESAGDEKEEKKYSFEQKGTAEELAKIKDESLEMVLFDLGEFARVYPRGKSLIEDFKGKNRIMFAMGHQNPRVKKAALLCVQKMMVQNWEFLNKTGAGKDKEKQKQDQ